MNLTLLRPLALVAGAAAGLAAGCNSTDDGTGSGSSTTNASATGVWSGTDSVSGLAVTAIINAAGDAVFMRSDGILFVGPAQVSNDTLAVAVDGYSDFPTTFSDGSSYGIGTLNGTVSTGSSIAATLTFTTNGNTAISGTWSLSFAAESNNASSTSAVSGNYTDTVTGAVLAISSNGVMTSQNASNSCVLNGSISTDDSTHNIYEVAYSFENCTGTYASVNGVQFTGLATLNTAVAPAQLTMAVSGASSSSKYGIVSTLNGS